MTTRSNIIDKIFTLMLVSVFFTNGITKLLNLEQTMKTRINDLEKELEVAQNKVVKKIESEEMMKSKLNR